MTSEEKSQKGAWLTVGLLFVFMAINSADKAVIGIAGVDLMKDLKLTPKQFGAIVSSFFYLFSISAIVTGFIANRVQARWILLVMGLIWAVTQFPMIGTISIATLYTCRIALGAGEGPAYPVALHATYKWFPNERRTLPTGLIAEGTALGAVIALPVLQWVIEHYTWHWAFGILGFVGLAWILVWILLGKEGTLPVTIEASNGRSFDRVPYTRLIFNGTTISVFIVSFGAYWGVSLLVGWFPPYLIQGLGFSRKMAGWISTIPWACHALTVVGSGWLSQRMLARGITTRVARGIYAGAGVAIGGLAIVLVPFVPSAGIKAALIIIGLSVPAVIFMMGHPIVSEFTPASQRGAMLAIVNAVATSAGLVGPFIMGSMIQNAATKVVGYQNGFLVCGIIALFSGLIGMIFLRPEAERDRFAALYNV
jgi:MFS transporter, ACS family, D-galactonate transporter